MLSIGAVNTTIVQASPPTVNETVIGTTSLVSTPKDSVIVLLLFMVAFTPGTGQTGVFFRVRQGTTVAGTPVSVNVGENTLNASGVVRTFMATDIAISGAQNQWSFTFAGFGNTGNANITSVLSAVLFLA